MENTTLGYFEGKEHFYKVRIFYEDTDFSGVVYHANYLKYFERARSSFLALCNIEHNDLWQNHGVAFSIKEITVNLSLIHI